MKATLLLLAASLAVSVSAAAHSPLHAKRFASNGLLAKRQSVQKRQCKQRPQQAPAPKKPAPKANPPAPKKADPPTDDSNNDNSDDSTPPANTGVTNVKAARCGPSGATKNTTSTTGPNGSIDFLNCGVNSGGGWNPPYMTVNDIISVDLSAAINKAPFSACKDFQWAFEQFGKEAGVPPLLLASFALQESSCNPSTVGGAGEQGLMQLTKDKCGGAPGGNCKDIGYNVRTGAQYFAGLLKDNNNDLLLCIGMYNGWHNGMTIGDATAQANSCCRCQNNLDYLFQFMNGWLLGIDAYQARPRLGKYFNLDQCGH